jgi:hypothetical protein
MATWLQLIQRAMNHHGESVTDITASAPPMETGWLNTEFHSGYGGSEGCDFTVWTLKRVYFPVTHDGKESCSSVSRHPDGVATPHVGGE